MADVAAFPFCVTNVVGLVFIYCKGKA